MGLLVFSYRRQSIIARKADINLKLLQLRQRQMDLQSYASSIADGSVSMNDLMGAPASVFGRMTGYMTYSHQQALMGAQASIGGMLAMAQMNGTFNNLQPQMQEQYKQMIFKNLYDKERERFNQQEQKVLNGQDKRIEQQVAQLSTQLQMLEAEEKGVEKAESEDAQKSAPKFGLG
jgi:hypothetical protein